MSMWRRYLRLLAFSQCGQSMIETAVALPLLLLLAFNAINFAYLFFAAINITAAPRNGVQYAVTGPNTPSQLSYPSAGPSTDSTTISYLTYQDVTGVLPSASGAKVQVCTLSLGIAAGGAGTSTQKPLCAQYGGASAISPDPDPEAPIFVLCRVDVTYEVQFPITKISLPFPGGSIPLVFGAQAGNPFNIRKQASMRNM
jgi:Flp pilus assembly protein TadG